MNNKHVLPQSIGLLVLSLILGLIPGTSRSGDFEGAYRAALTYDERYQAARHALTYSEEGVPLARSGLLPSVYANISETAVQGTREVSGAASVPLDYRAPSQSLNVRAPIINVDGWQRLKQAEVQSDAARSVFSMRKADLVDRLTLAYLQRMLAEDSFQAIHAQIQAVIAQRNLMRKRLDQGEGTKTEFAEARANLSLVQAQWADARDAVTNTRATLEMLTGQKRESITRLGDVFSPPPLEPGDLGKWREMALANNPAVEAKRQFVEVARAGVAAGKSGHLPRLDLVASASNSRNDSVSTLNQSLSQTTVGLQLNIPIYSGGAITATVRQALAEQARAESEYQSERRNLELEVERLFQVMQNGKSKLDAYEESLEASRLALDGTQKAQLSGLRTNTDVLEAARKVSQAKRDLAQARYDYILQRLRLYIRAGLDPELVVARVDEMLNPPAVRR